MTLHGSAEYSAEILVKIAEYSDSAKPEIYLFGKGLVLAEQAFSRFGKGSDSAEPHFFRFSAQLLKTKKLLGERDQHYIFK